MLGKTELKVDGVEWEGPGVLHWALVETTPQPDASWDGKRNRPVTQTGMPTWWRPRRRYQPGAWRPHAVSPVYALSLLKGASLRVPRG